jgi:hypothetical protein
MNYPTIFDSISEFAPCPEGFSLDQIYNVELGKPARNLTQAGGGFV